MTTQYGIKLQDNPSSTAEEILMQILMELRILNMQFQNQNPDQVDELQSLRQDPFVNQIFPQP